MVGEEPFRCEPLYNLMFRTPGCSCAWNHLNLPWLLLALPCPHLIGCRGLPNPGKAGSCFRFSWTEEPPCTTQSHPLDFPSVTVALWTNTHFNSNKDFILWVILCKSWRSQNNILSDADVSVLTKATVFCSYPTWVWKTRPKWSSQTWIK